MKPAAPFSDDLFICLQGFPAIIPAFAIFRRPLFYEILSRLLSPFESLDAPETLNFAAEAHAETRARFWTTIKRTRCRTGFWRRCRTRGRFRFVRNTARGCTISIRTQSIRRACTACVRRRPTVRVIPSGKSCFQWRISTSCSATMCIWAGCRTWWSSPIARC